MGFIRFFNRSPHIEAPSLPLEVVSDKTQFGNIKDFSSYEHVPKKNVLTIKTETTPHDGTIDGEINKGRIVHPISIIDELVISALPKQRTPTPTLYGLSITLHGLQEKEVMLYLKFRIDSTLNIKSLIENIKKEIGDFFQNNQVNHEDENALCDVVLYTIKEEPTQH